MQRESKGWIDEMANPFGVFRGFGGFGTQRSSLFGGRDPFDDSFFSRPFESLFDHDAFDSGATASSGNAQKSNGGKGVLIEELLSDDEEGSGNEENGDMKHSTSGKEPLVEHPQDDGDVERKIQNVNQRSDFDRVEGTQSQSRTFGFQTCKVTYGGVDGAYYTSTRTRKAGSDGVVLEESKEADRTTGQATHRISRGIHDKGHSFTRKLNSDGRVDTTQTLHNLNEDELMDFEQAWKGNSGGHLSGWRDGFNMHGTSGSNSSDRKREASWGGWLLPSLEQTRRGADTGARTNAPGVAPKKVVRINIE